MIENKTTVFLPAPDLSSDASNSSSSPSSFSFFTGEGVSIFSFSFTRLGLVFVRPEARFPRDQIIINIMWQPNSWCQFSKLKLEIVFLVVAFFYNTLFQ